MTRNFKEKDDPVEAVEKNMFPTSHQVRIDMRRSRWKIRMKDHYLVKKKKVKCNRKPDGNSNLTGKCV